MAYTLGIDFGTNSVRALLVDCADGKEVGTFVVNYPSGDEGVLLHPSDPHVARQNPGDYLFGLEGCVLGALAQAEGSPAFSAAGVIGIGVDSTGSSPIPVNEANVPIAFSDEWKGNLSAQCWLWKDHTSHAEAAKITEIAARHRPQYIAKCGNTYSSEWFWAKIWHCLNTAPDVFAAAHSWVELADYIPSVLGGVTDPLLIRRGICAAGHKALYSGEWGGLPDEEFLAMLNPELAALRGRLYADAFDATEPAGFLCPEWARKLGLRAGIPIAIGEFDVHYGAIGSGIQEGVLVKAIGTSTCDCCVVPVGKQVIDIPGICGIVNGSILPGFYGIEAGQSAVGDIFKWWVQGICGGDASLHTHLAEQAREQKPGQAGLLALDWNNGNRTVLVNPMLTGLLLGQTLHTTRAEIYRALVEATAFGARVIIERLEEYGVRIDYIVCCGGIAERNPFLMQIYADVTGRAMRVAGSPQACALGGAVAAAVLAGSEAGGHPDFPTAQAVMTSLKPETWTPNPENKRVYDRIYALYLKLHDAFGWSQTSADLSRIMRDLILLRQEQNA